MKFGVREIVDVVFKAADNMRIGNKTFQKYQPVFMIDTATTSSLEQATTTVYAQGGKGYSRLIAWEGEKTMTFTVTDALMSPMGLAVLTGAGLINPDKTNQAHVHTTLNVLVDGNGEATVSVADLNEEFGLTAEDYVICNTIEMFATELDGSGAGIGWFTADIKNKVGDYTHIEGSDVATFVVNGASNTTVQLDFYVIMNNSVTEVQIEPGSFGGYFYIEAQTLFRREDTGKDMAAELIIPKAKVQSAFTFTMAASGDPSTFDFVMDAMPGYTRFDSTKKQMCVIQIIGDDKKAANEKGAHTHENPTEYSSPSYESDYEFDTSVALVSATAPNLPIGAATNQAAVSIATVSGDKIDTITITANGDLNEEVQPKPSWPKSDWIAVDYNTGESTIAGISYTNRGTTTVLGTEDIQDANELGLPAGHMVVWVRKKGGTLPAAFTLSKDQKEVSVSINIV